MSTAALREATTAAHIALAGEVRPDRRRADVPMRVRSAADLRTARSVRELEV